MGFEELGTCPFNNINHLTYKFGGQISPTFELVKEKLRNLLPNMVYEEGKFDSITDCLAVKVFTQTTNLNVALADTVYRLYQNMYHHTELWGRKNKIILSDREIPLKFSGKFYSFRQEGYIVEVGVVGTHIAIHFHLD